MIKKVFIIDDDEISVYLTSAVLELTGYVSHIQSFSNADEAFAEIVQLKLNEMPEVILLDLNMPHKTGWDFLDMLLCCETDLLGRTSIYILTSSIAESDRMISESYPLVTGFLHKPLDEDGLAVIQDTYQPGSR